MKIGLACDHAGFEYKEKIKKYLENKEIIKEIYVEGKIINFVL